LDTFLVFKAEEESQLESCHAVSYAMKLGKKMRKDQNIIVTLSGRGDKDIDQVIKYRKKYIGG
jgi:tryptophan synthase beta chain